MARARNLEKRDAIRTAAEHLMMESGYGSASYTAIAARAGVSRGQVQYYFPKKTQIITGLLNRALDLSRQCLDQEGLRSPDGYVTLFRAGQIYFTFLLQDEQMRALTLDVVADRQITSELLFLNQQWAGDFLHPQPERLGDFEEDFALVVGGCYELCYRHLSRGQAIDVPDLIERMLFSFMTLNGVQVAEARWTLKSAALDAHMATDMASRIRQDLSGAPDQPMAGQ